MSDPTQTPTPGTDQALAQWVVLRLSSLAEDDLLNFADEQEAAVRGARNQTPWSVLVVDDDEEVHRAIDLALGDVSVLGRPLVLHHCNSASTAHDRLIVDGGQLDLVLLDVVMETVDAGLNLLEEIRALPATRDLPVLLHTGQPGKAPEIIVRRRYDISGYLTKSAVTRPTLIAALEAALSGKAVP